MECYDIHRTTVETSHGKIYGVAFYPHNPKLGYEDGFLVVGFFIEKTPGIPEDPHKIKNSRYPFGKVVCKRISRELEQKIIDELKSKRSENPDLERINMVERCGSVFKKNQSLSDVFFTDN